MNHNKKLMGALAAAGVLMSGAAQAALVDRGGGLIYDTVLNITWLQDANYAKTSGYDADGQLTWAQATNWAANLSYYDSIRNVAYTDWRLPSTTDLGEPGPQFGFTGTDFGYNVVTSGSELAHLWYVDFLNKAFYDTVGNGPQPGWGLVNDAANANDESLFTNIQSDVYWSGTAYVLSAWAFNTGFGIQDVNGQTNISYAWAVRPGDVAAIAQTVSEPMSLTLFGLGLAGLGIGKRRHTR